MPEPDATSLPAPGGRSGSPVLYVVARDRPSLYERLNRRLADEGIQVVLDRRRAERRRALLGVDVEHRSAERRINMIQADLQRRGWAIVRLGEAPGCCAGGLGPGDRVVLRRYNPILPHYLVGRSGRVLDLRRVRATVHFDGEAKPRCVDVTDLAPLTGPLNGAGN
jgi:hypothetical protein